MTQDAKTERLAALEAATRYQPGEVEEAVFRRWEEADIFAPSEPRTAATREPYSIAIPPPNVTGALHMGHALNGSIQDALIRMKRMQGYEVKWILGTDHAGIATQAQVEKLLASEGTDRHALGREQFVERVWQWREQYGATIIDQFKRLGASCDYGDEHFTMDEAYARAVGKVFVALYEKGYIYRDNYMVNWDPGTGSAISDLEVEDVEVDGALYSIDYPLADGSGVLTVATTRPETMLGDTAVAVNPNDARYADVIGMQVNLPLTDRQIPVIADEHVTLDFGTGALKITPGHDPNDFEIGRKHGLPELSVIGEDGRMTPEAGEFAGMKVLEAREAVVARLRELDLLREVKPHRHVVPHSHRSGERIEPLISLQWFCRMDELAKDAADVVRNGQVRFVPERWGGVYLQWMENIRPWCISRQLWWGHQLPVWYRTGTDEVHVGIEAPTGDGWVRDEDVLDTWFSSALWPFATLGWPDETDQLATFYPTNVLSTARDIIFLWVARMVMMGLEFTGQVPFQDVYIHSVIQAPDGRRMSKSLGTGIDPLEQIDEYGADAVRFGLLAMSSSQDVRYSADKVRQGQDLANKLWNASRFVLMRVDDVEPAARPETVEDRWILSRLQTVTQETTKLLDEYDFSHAALGLYDFLYGDLCDWYLELCKPRLYDDDADTQALSATLLHVLSQTLKLLHPIMPFVTEEIWSLLPDQCRAGNNGSVLSVAEFPSANDALIDKSAEAQISSLIAVVTALRRHRDSAGLNPGTKLEGRLVAGGYEELSERISKLARIDFADLDLTATDDGHPEVIASIAIPRGVVELYAGAGIDLEEIRRKALARKTELEAEIPRIEQKLANAGFVEKAPPQVVQAERNKLATYREELAALDA